MTPLLLASMVALAAPPVARVRAEAEPCHPLIDAWLRAEGANPRGAGGRRVQAGTAYPIHDDLWATAGHVVHGTAEVALHVGDRVWRAPVVSLSGADDLALLRAPTPARWPDAAPAEQGASVTVWGFPGDGPHTSLRGTVGAQLPIHLRGRPPFLATRIAVPVRRGLSGAPAMAGPSRVGMIVAGSRPDSALGGDGLLLAEPALSSAIDRLLHRAPTRRAGVRVRPGTDVWTITEVRDDTPAHRAGLQVGDEIVALDGQAVRALASVAEAASTASIWTVSRRETTLHLTLESGD